MKNTKTVHMFGKASKDGFGRISAKCFKSARPIDMQRATWTINPKRVTCRKCLKAIKERGLRGIIAP
jgi:hypothetical protein